MSGSRPSCAPGAAPNTSTTTCDGSISPARSDTPRLPQCRHWTATQDGRTDLTPIEPCASLPPYQRDGIGAQAQQQDARRAVDDIGRIDDPVIDQARVLAIGR